MTDHIVAIIEIIGGAAFALSGAAVAIEHRLDIFGVLVLALTTAAGGGVLRDIMLGVTPPVIFSNPVYLAVCLAVSVLFILLTFFSRGRMFLDYKTRMQSFINIVDAVGLGIFAALGTKASLAVSRNYLLAVFIGTVTAVGGGILRDVSVAVPPRVFRKHIYAVAAIGGCVIYCILTNTVPEWAALSVSVISVIAVRVLASHFRWNLPIISDGQGSEKSSFDK